MTTFLEIAITCGACAHAFKHKALTSTNTFGSPDLDTRPAEMQRSTMDTWIARCPACGYCSKDVQEYESQFAVVIQSPEYQAQLIDPGYPELTNTFICAAMIAEACDNSADSGWAWLHAAWTLDDTKNKKLAREARSTAADRFLAVLGRGEQFSEQDGASELITVECLRRVGRMEEALKLIHSAKRASPPDVIEEILNYELALIESGDKKNHLIQDALKNK